MTTIGVVQDASLTLRTESDGSISSDATAVVDA
jgi:hypothetical protein